MVELTKEQCLELEKRALEKLGAKSDASGASKLYSTLASVAVRATIVTLQEYEKMKADAAASQQ